MEKKEMFELIDKAVEGDKDSLEKVILSVRDLIFNLSLRMLGSFNDAQDATQDIILKVMTNLSSFKKKSAFSTWVFKIAANYLIDYKKHMFAKMPLSFEFYAKDIVHANVEDVPDLTGGVDKNILSDELKMSCTNVMLQCLNANERCIFILGTMFKLDSQIAGEILGLTAPSYRKRLSRIRKKVAEFLKEYCGEYGDGKCKCFNRVNYAIENHRINPNVLDFNGANEIPLKTMVDVKEAMEEAYDISLEFECFKMYESSENIKKFIIDFLNNDSFKVVEKA